MKRGMGGRGWKSVWLLVTVAVAMAVVQGAGSLAQEVGGGSGLGNQAERLEWFRDLGFGMFIHWSLDSQVGSVISHSMVAADEGYLRRFVEELPKTFHPRKFYPQDWAVLAKLAGMKYVVFTTKHHSGFCMFNTKTTDFSIMKTPFGRDATAEILESFRVQGVAPGIYFSPDDFWWLWKHGITIQRNVPEVQPRANPGLMAHDQQQVRELLTGYGPIDVLFFDGEAEGLKELAWELQKDVVVTRGAINTPEQYIPGLPLDEAWESCFTMGTQWQYKPTNEVYKTGGEVIGMLIETRAKGGNLLLNVGPKPDGELPIEQEERLREVALWMLVNSECIHGVRPWIITNEGPVWFTRKRGTDTVYAIVKEKDRWKYGEWKEFVLKSVKATDQTLASVLSQNDKVLEYRPEVVPATTWKQEGDGLHIRAMRAQRLYNNREWPNPVVIKLEHVAPGLEPPRIRSVGVKWEGSGSGPVAVCEGMLESLGDTSELEVGFEYRDITGMDAAERERPWEAGGTMKASDSGAFQVKVEGLKRGSTYEFRAVAKHPLLNLYGAEVKAKSL